MPAARTCVCLATILVLAWAAPSLLLADTYFVRQEGNDKADGQSPPTAFRTLGRAAQVLNHGDVVLVGPGVYRESLMIGERFGTENAPLCIVGDEKGRSTASPPGPVVIEPATPDAPALHVQRAKHLFLSGLTFRGSGEGVRLENCRTTLIQRCTFDGLAKGLSLSLCQDVRVESTVIKRCTIGLLASQSSEIRIAHVTLVGSSSVGLFVLSCGPGAVRNSILVGNNTSLVADPSSAMAWTSDYNVVHGTMGAWGLVPVTYNAHEWFAASGQERHSVYVVPDFADPDKFDLHIAPQATWGGGLPGMFVGQKLDPEVKLDRDGRPFTVREGAVGAGAYDYPEPTPGAGWRKLPIRLSADAPRQSAAVYRADGTLLRMLVADAAGVRDLWWDGRDDQGQPLPGGQYTVRGVSHDVRLLNDGHFGDNGNPLGTYNCDNADRVVAFPDGSFVVSTVYDEAGVPLRYHAASGQPLSGSALAEKDIWDIAAEGQGKTLICGIEKKLVRVVPPGERTRMASGAESYPLLAGGERLATEADGKRERQPTGLAVLDGVAYVGLPGLDIVRGIELKTGRKTVDWQVPAVADVQAGEKGTLWAIAGTDVVQLTPPSGPGRRIPTKLATPRYLAAGSGRLAVIDRQAARIAVIDAASGQLLRTLGKDRPAGQWQPVRGDAYRGPRDAAFLPDGRLLLTEAGRIRALWPDSGSETFSVLSNFMDNAIPHPAKPEYVYCYGGNVFRIDPATDAWTWVLEGPPSTTEISLRQMSTRVTLGGRHFILAHNHDGRPREGGKPLSTYCLFDVTDPVHPRLSTLLPVELWAYSDLRFTREGHMVIPQPESLQFKIVPFQGLDGQQHPKFDFEHGTIVGVKKDPEPRAMSHKSGVTLDPASNDFYYLAVTTAHNKMVPFWGASASGVGRSRADGTPLWFALSSGGNYTSISLVRDARDLWVFAGKDFGGQVDVFDVDGLRLTTSNWGWASNWQSGFVDMRDAVQAYLRPDGKPAVWVEDDNIGRFNRCRLDGGETVRRTAAPLAWSPSGAAAGPAPRADRTGGRALQRPLVLPKKAMGWPVDGDWSKWEAAGIVPQMICLPIVAWVRTAPGDLMQTMRAGTAVGAFAHDGQHVYAYFLVADDSPHFDSPTGERMWMYDSIELWLEEEQIGLGFRQDGRPQLFKYRFHDRAGKEYAPGYALPDANIWGRVLPSLAEHPLGRHLAAATGKSFEGRAGYALMAKIPFEDIKLVGGIAGRPGGKILPMTGQAGEIIRIGVAIDCISYWGREQDYKVYWPCGLMFSDPTRNVPFALGE